MRRLISLDFDESEAETCLSREVINNGGVGDRAIIAESKRCRRPTIDNIVEIKESDGNLLYKNLLIYFWNVSVCIFRVFFVSFVSEVCQSSDKYSYAKTTCEVFP